MLTTYYAPEKVDWEDTRKKIFLAGSIDNGNASNWQAELISALQGLDLILLNPRRKEWDSSWENSINNLPFVAQVNWELEGLEKADYKLFYFAKGSQSPITLLELGLHGQQQAVVCCPDGFWRKGNIEVVCKRYNILLMSSIEQLIAHITQHFGN